MSHSLKMVNNGGTKTGENMFNINSIKIAGTAPPERCVFNKNKHLVRSGTLFKPTLSLCFLEKVSHFFRASRVGFGGSV